LGLLALGPDGGVAAGPGQAALRTLRRTWALVTLGYLTWLGILSLRAGGQPRRVGVLVLVLAWLQAGIGAASVAGGLPSALALAHNATAALLLLPLVGLYVPRPVILIQDRRGSAEGGIE
jgi:heme A synthase